LRRVAPDRVVDVVDAIADVWPEPGSNRGTLRAALIVTTKANGTNIDVFDVGHNGRISDAFVANPATTPVPFGIAFDAAGHLAIKPRRTP
jgi:hypothetical protein